jgi:hypothetical protein
MGKGADPGGGAVDGGNPILLVLLTRLEKSSSGQARDDEIDEEQPRVIVAGFGRFGQIAGRLPALQRGEDGDPRS